MTQDDPEPQPWDNMNDAHESSLFSWGLLAVAMALLSGILIGVLISQKSEKESTVITSENTESIHQDNPGNFVILENNTTSITFIGFEGELIWYESPERSHFHPMGHDTIEDKKPIQVPVKARAFLKKGKSIGETYSMDETSSPTY